MAKNYVTSMRLSTEAKRLLDALGGYYGLSHSSVMEMMLRDHARRLELDAKPHTDATPAHPPRHPAAVGD